MYVKYCAISNWLKKYVRVYQELIDRIDCHWHNVGTAWQLSFYNTIFVIYMHALQATYVIRGCPLNRILNQQIPLGSLDSNRLPVLWKLNTPNLISLNVAQTFVLVIHCCFRRFKFQMQITWYVSSYSSHRMISCHKRTKTYHTVHDWDATYNIKHWLPEIYACACSH
jgi:hypothetical protein